MHSGFCAMCMCVCACVCASIYVYICVCVLCAHAYACVCVSYCVYFIYIVRVILNAKGTHYFDSEKVETDLTKQPAIH